MELYLSACSKAANVAASKTATSSMATDNQQCGDGAHKTHFPGVGAAQLLDLPLGVKLPVIPGSNTLYYTTNLSEKLFRPSYDFNLSDPYCRLLENQYKSLHDPHLRSYYKRKDILRKLKKGGYITSNNKIVCTLRELNKYRQYLTSLKLDFERNYIREQKMLSKQVNKLQENNQLPRRFDIAQFQNWLLQESTQPIKDQEQLIRHRYLDMISKELEHLERTAEEQRLLQMDREERRQREQTRRKLSLRRKMEEEWKSKEMLLLTRIGEDVKREARIEEQRRKSREESDRKKQALLEKKMAYHLQKMQGNGFKKEETEKAAFDHRGQDGAYPGSSPKKKKKIHDDGNLLYDDQKPRSTVNGIYRSRSSLKNIARANSIVNHLNIQDNDTEQKEFLISVCITEVAAQNVTTTHISPTRNFHRSSQSYLDPPKDEETNGDWNEKSNKKSSYICETESQTQTTAQGIFPSRAFSNTQQKLPHRHLQEKVTSEELNSIIHNIMTWVVATVTSILYPAITKYEQRLRNNVCPVSEDSILSSDSSSFCSTCSEEFTYRSYTTATTKTFQGEPCAFAVDISVKKPTTTLKPPSAHVERTVVGKTYHLKKQSITSELKYNKTSMTYICPSLRSCKSDSHLLTTCEAGPKKCKDATTETDHLESSQLSDQKTKAMNELKNLNNVFVNFKCHLKGETELILESIFQEIMSDLTQAIPSLSYVTAEVFVDQGEPEKGDMLSNVDIASAASEIVDNMLEKLQCAVEKKCVELYSQEDSSVDIKPSLTPTGENLTSSIGKPLKASVPPTAEPMCDIAEDMVHAILEKLMTLTSSKQNNIPHLDDATKFSYQKLMTDPTRMHLKRTDKNRCSPKPDADTLIAKEKIKNLISSIFSQSSLVGYIEEAVNTILGYVQTELNNEKLIASEETVILLQFLDDLFTQLHKKPEKAEAQKCKHSRLRKLSDPDEKYRLTSAKLSHSPTSGRPLPPVNVPGMVLYSEDDNEEIEKIVKSVLDSSFNDETAKSPQIPENWLTRGNTSFEYKRNTKLPTKLPSRSKPAFLDAGLKTELPSLSNKPVLKERACLNNDNLIFNQEQKHQIQKASENIVKSILTELLKDFSSVPPSALDSKTSKPAPIFISEKSLGLSDEEWADQMFSVSEVSTVAQEITEAVLNILHRASSCFPNTTKSSILPSVHQSSLESSETPHKGDPNKKPLNIWFESEKKMKYLSSLNSDSSKPSPSKLEESEPEPIDNINNKIVNTVFESLKSFLCPKLQMCFKGSPAQQSSFQNQLSTYTAKVVNIVLHAIQNELELSKKNVRLRERDHSKCLQNKGFFADNDELESPLSNSDDDIMASPLLSCICEMLSSGHSDQSNISLPSDMSKPATSYKSDSFDKQNILPSRQDKKSFHKYLATPCALHTISNGKVCKENASLKVLDSIGEALLEMLWNLIGAHSHSQPFCSKLSRDRMKQSQPTSSDLQSNIQLISKTILEYILARLCNVDMDTSFADSGCKVSSESLGIDNLSFASIIEGMAKCTDMISSIVSRMIPESDKEETKIKAKTIAPVSSKTEDMKERHTNKLKLLASDILNVVFAKLEGFANGNLETLGSMDENKKSSKMDLGCESTNVFTDTNEEKLLQSTLYVHAKKISSTILKAIQAELNASLSDLRTDIKSPPHEKQMLKNVVNLILDAVSADMFNDTESEERGTETFHYKPTYGNHLPGGAESDSFQEDDKNTEKELMGLKTSLTEETKSDSLKCGFKAWVLERTLNRIEVQLKEPQKSPIIPIIRNILNEIFQNVLVNQLNVLSLSHLSGFPQNVDERVAQSSDQFIDKTMDPLVSEADVTVVVDDIVKTVFHKLYSAAMTERNANKNRYKTITFSTNVSFHEHIYGRESSISVLDKNPCTLESRFNINEQGKVNVVKDIVQAVLTNLETFATSKVNSLFCPQISFTLPLPLPIQPDKTALNEALSVKDLYSDGPFSFCPANHIKSEKINSMSQLSLNKLNTYATEVARKILQGIKHELDSERESPFLTHNIVVSESIASHVVNTVLDIVSSKGKCDINNYDKEIDCSHQEGIIGKLFNKTEYRKVLQIQIQDTVEGILCDIYEKTLYQNNLSFAAPTLTCSIAGKHPRANSKMFIESTDKANPKLSVPKSDVILISNDVVDIVLHNLNSAVMLSIHAKDPTSARLPLTFCDTFPFAECQQSPLMGSTSERKIECFPTSRNLKPVYADNNKLSVVERQNTKKSVTDPYEENANFITKIIFDRLESFATERIDSLITLAFLSKESSVSSELENSKQGNRIIHESSQVESNVNILKISTETMFNQELTYSSYREKLGSTIHLSPAYLKEYADIIACAILELIKNDLDLEIQERETYTSNISFQENIIMSETVNKILKILYDKRPVKEITFYSKDNSNLFTQLTVSNEMLLEQNEQEENTELPLLSKHPLQQSQTLEKESQRIVLEEVFRRNRESKQKEKNASLSVVEEILNHVYQIIMETTDNSSPFNEISLFTPNSKIKTLDTTQKNIFQPRVNSVAKDIVESVLEKMYSVVVKSIYKSNKSREIEASDNNDNLPKKSSYIREMKHTGKGSNPTRSMIPQSYPHAESQSISLLENTFSQHSPLQVGKDLVQTVLNKITNFASIPLKVSPKGSPKPGFKTSLKSRTKVTQLPKFKAKMHLGSSAVKAKSKTKLSLGEMSAGDNRSKTTIGLTYILSTEATKNILETKLPTSELKMYAKKVVSNILETTVKELEKVTQTRTMVKAKVLPCDEIMAANKVVNMILQGLHAAKSHTLAFSQLDDLKLSQGNTGAGSFAKPQAGFYLENVSSQLEQIFPKEGIFRKTFDKWQAEGNAIENEKCKLLMIAENVLTEISIKAKELEYSLSLLNLPPLEHCEGKFHNHFKGASTRAEDTKTQINVFAKEIVEILLENLQLCFLSQMPTPDSKETLPSINEHSATKSKYDLPTKDVLTSVKICNTKIEEDAVAFGSSNQIVQKIIERVLNMLESFVDLQFKCISKYEFSEIVKMPIENLFPVQQRLLSKKMLPKVQPLKKFHDESKSSTISKENIQNTLLQVHSFHSELFTYAVDSISDMFGIIKNKLDKEISQEEPSSVNILKENIAASEIIGTLMDECTHFHESFIQNLPKENLFQGTENTYIVNHVELATNVEMPTSKIKEVSFGNSPTLTNASDLVFYSDEDMKKQYGASSNLPKYDKVSVENTVKSSQPMEISHLENMPSSSRNKIQDDSPRKSTFGHFGQTMRENSLPEGSVLQKMFKKANKSTEATLKEVMSFIEMGKSENPRVFHYQTSNPVGEPNQIQTTVSPLKICLAAENIVNTVLSSYGFPSQPLINDNMETIKPFFISKQNTFSDIPKGQKNEERSLLRMWDKRITCIPEGENKEPEASGEYFSLLQKWKNRMCPTIKSLKKVEIIAFADYELGPNEIHLVARHVTTSVITFLKDFKTTVSSENKVSIVSTLSRKIYESKQPLRSIYNNSSLYQFCEHLTESVIYHLISSISDNTSDSRENEKAWKSQAASFNQSISIDSQMFESRSISIGELALSISEIITEILFKGNIIEPEITQKTFSLKTKYIYCPGVAVSDFDDLFQDLLIGVIHVLSKEIGLTHHLESKGIKKSFSLLKTHSVPICNKTNTMGRQTDSKNKESSRHQNDHLIQKNKLNYLAAKLDSLVGSLKSPESKEVVNKVFNIVLELFLPDECQGDTMDSDKRASTFFLPSNGQKSSSSLENNLGLTPKSIFLLNVICEKLIRTLLEKCTNNVFLDNDSLSDETSTGECQLLKSLEDEEFGYLNAPMDSEQFQGDYMSDLLENLADMDQDLLSSDSMLTVISHSLVKSLMDKLSDSIQFPQSLPFTNRHLRYRTRKRQSSSIKGKRSELTELVQSKNSFGFISDNCYSLTTSLNSPSVVRSKLQAPFGRKYSVSSPSLSPFKRPETKKMDTLHINKLYPDDRNTRVYSAMFLEEVISELFFNLSTSLWSQHEHITETKLSEMNTILVNNVVKELNNSQVTVLRNAEERRCFPPIHKETVSRIVNSVYCDVLQHYKMKVTCDKSLAHDSNSIVEQITNGLLLETLDYQLPACFRGKVIPNSYYPLNAEVILQKLQNNLREFTSKARSSTDYCTMLSHSFLEDTIRRLLSQLIPPHSKTSSLGKQYVMSSDINEKSTCIVDKVIAAISKHKIWFTMYDNQYLHTGENLQKMVDSVYSNLVHMSDSVVSIQKSIVSQSPVMVDKIASLIIQEIIENHLQPFLFGEDLSRPKTPLDSVSSMVKQVLCEVLESHRPENQSPSGIYPDTFVGEIVARLLSKIFSPKHNTETEMENMTQRIVNSIKSHFDRAEINIPNGNTQFYPFADSDTVDNLVTSVYRNVLKQYGLDPDVDNNTKDTDIFVENITKLVTAAISDYLLHPLFSGDLSTASCSMSRAHTIVQDILSNISKSAIPGQILSPYNTLLPYTFLEDMVRILLSKIFPSVTSSIPNREILKDRSRGNFNEVASKLISDIRMKISQHEIRFSNDEETKTVYSDDEVQHLVDSVFENISQDSEYPESTEQNISSNNDILIDRIAGFIIKYICKQHLQPFVDGKASSSSYGNVEKKEGQWFNASVYSSTFLENVVSGVLSKIFHRVIGIVQTKSVIHTEDELFDKAENLIHLIAEEFSKSQVNILENAEEQLCLPPVEREIVKNTIDMIYSKVLQEYEMEIMPDKNFLDDTKTLAARITKILLDETFDFQIHPNITAKLPFIPHHKLNTNVLIKRVHCDIAKSRFRRQASTIYTTKLSNTDLEKIVTQLISQMSSLTSNKENPEYSQSDLSNTVIKLINEIMSIISKHAICITKHRNEKQSMISEKDIQSMADSIYADLLHLNLPLCHANDKKGVSNIPVSKIASFIIKEIFNHHLQSFLSEDKKLFPPSTDKTYKQKAIDPKQEELSLIVNSASFLEEVISELLCKLLCEFSLPSLTVKDPETVNIKITDIVTTLVKSIVLEFTSSEILVADNFDEKMCFSETYKEMVQKTVNIIYEKILDEYKILTQVYKDIQYDPACFGRKIYHLILEEIYDYQVQSLVSGGLASSSSYSLPHADNIIRNVLNVVMNNRPAFSPCITVLPRSLLEDMIYKLLTHIFPSPNSENELSEEEVSGDEFMDAASKLTDEIIEEISEHEIRLATAEQNAGSTQLEAIENLIDSVCNNILKKSEFQAEVQKDTGKKGGSFLSKIAGFIMKGILDHHLKPFLHDEESSLSHLPDTSHVSVLTDPDKEKRQPSLYSATFLEDVIVNLVRKFYPLPSITKESEKKEMPEPDIVGLAIKFTNSLIREFRKSEIKVLQNAEELFSFPPIDKETIDNISNFVYDQFIVNYGSNDIQTDGKDNIFIEVIATLAQKAISAFKIQTLFSGDWSSTFFSFLNPDKVTQKVQHIPQETSPQINRCLKGNQFTLPEQSSEKTSPISAQKKVLDTLEIEGYMMSKKNSFKTEKTPLEKSAIQDPIVTAVASITKNMTNLLSGSPADMANNKKKQSEVKVEISNKKYETISQVTSPTTSVKSKDIQESNLTGTLTKSKIEKTSMSISVDEEKQGNVAHTQLLVAPDDTEYMTNVLEPDSEIADEKKTDKTRATSLRKSDKSIQFSSLVSEVRNIGTMTENTLETNIQKRENQERKDSQTQVDTNEEPNEEYEHIQNVIGNIYDNVLHLCCSRESDYSKSSSDTASTIIQKVDKDFAKSVPTKDLAPTISLPDKENEEKGQRGEQGDKKQDVEKEKVNVKEVKNEPTNPEDSQYPRKNKPGILPAKFLEDVITEMVNTLIFSSSPKTQADDRYQDVNNDESQTQLYDTAMKLTDSLLKEFANAQIKVFRPERENQFPPPIGKLSPIPKETGRHKESTTDSSRIKRKTVDKMPNKNKMPEKSSSNKIPFLDKIPLISETMVNKIVHSSVCNILKEHRSQDSICKDINSNGEKIARQLTSSVINEILQHQLNLIFCDEIPASGCLPLDSKDVVKKVQKVVQTASKECQTSSPYTIMLTHEFLEKVVSALLSKIFSTDSNIEVELSIGNLFTELDFLQIKLISIIKTEISKDEDMIIHYVESLHPNDDEIIQLVVHSIYDNLLSQFGSQEIIKDCVSSGCRILSEAIVDLVLREVAGNQLQNYFSGELTPNQCAEVDSVVENILKDVVQTADAPHLPPPQAHTLPCNIVEEIAVKFLSKLLSIFPNVDKDRNNSLQTEMQNITSKILNSIQEFISKSKIKLVPPAKELPTMHSDDNATIEKVVNSVYANILKHSGSQTSVLKDLMGKSNVLSDIIGFLMVKEISNYEFQPQEEEEVSSSELVLETVKVMKKVIKILDEFHSQGKSSSIKGSMLDATFLEEALALFLAKIVKLPSTSSKDEKPLSKPELNRIASQLTKSVTAEISKSNINLVAADPADNILQPESIEMVSQVIDSIYSTVLQQSGTQEELYYDIKDANKVFPKKVASLILTEVTNCPLERVISVNSNVDHFSDLDISRIVQKAEEHADKMTAESKSMSNQTLMEEGLPIKIVPYIGQKPIKIDPGIISKHLAVISVKTKPIEKLKKECLRNTGQSITELRKASISGKGYLSPDIPDMSKIQRERRISLNKLGRLDVRPLEAACRNSFQNVRKPDITKVELLKDVHNKEELIIRLVAHDIEQAASESSREEESDNEEVILREVTKEEILEKSESKIKETISPVGSKVFSPKPIISTSNLKKFLSISKCCQPTSSANIENIEATSNPIIEPTERQIKRAVAKLSMARPSTSFTDTDSTREKMSQHKKEEKNTAEPTHYLIHRIMSSSSYNQEDLISSAGETEDHIPDANAKRLEESSREQKPENSNSFKFITIYEGNKNILGSECHSKEVISETPKSSGSKHGPNMLVKVSSALSKVFSRSNSNTSKSRSPPHHDKP
ncbi:PREDICTED: fibrous sheath-interacting protein 2 [Condylura cristata]|uniref:fibrous sheath-interacting protein 2 n=1 Tax=Condylura cristata TaxID=143302 RepID=UPI0003346F5A|nr:PREDICTED: fibrous sheath-interacting protein 2 [Condylura cristata]